MTKKKNRDRYKDFIKSYMEQNHQSKMQVLFQNPNAVKIDFYEKILPQGFLQNVKVKKNIFPFTSRLDFKILMMTIKKKKGKERRNQEETNRPFTQ